MRLWLARHRARSFWRNSLWVMPGLGMVAALAAVRIIHAVEVAEGWESGFAAASVTAVLGALASAVFTLIVFVASALLITMQLASAQLTPRVIGVLFRDRLMRVTLTICVFAFTLTLATVLRVRETAPALSVNIAAWSCVVALGAFLYLIDHVAKYLRPSGTLLSVVRLAHGVIAHSYPKLIAAAGPDPASVVAPGPAAASIVVPSIRDGFVMAFDVRGLVELAVRHDAVIELIPQVGDFVAAGGPLFRVRAGTGGPPERALRDSVALGLERTLEQDPAFAFRIVVDVACKALSPAVNDPTTAVLAIDCVHELLSAVGVRRLDEGRVADGRGRLRLVYRTPQWPEFVQLAVTEIRQFGSESIQVARRLHAMIDSLIQTVPEERADSLRQEQKLLRSAIARRFPEPEDRAMADVPDQQGVGGASALASRDGLNGERVLEGPGAARGPTLAHSTPRGTGSTLHATPDARR